MQSSIYHNLNNSTVRDLYWLLFSESPLSETYDLFPFALFPKSILKEWQSTSEEYFLELDQKPGSLESFIKRKKNKRLGFYAESLLSFFFQTFSAVELLLQNIQIIEAQKTIGEVDFIIQYNDQVIHLECAVKYYLLKDSNQPYKASQWVGPRIKDSLALKLERMINYQLPLGSRKEIQEKINRPIDTSYLFLKGVFFAEFQRETTDNQNSIVRVQPHEFIRQSSLNNLPSKPVKILTHPNWLSATSPTIELKEETIPFDQKIINPTMVLFDDNKVRFVVPDNWG